jgi:large subunit ribosomal protein L13
MSYKTVSANSQTVDKKWLLVDAKGETLGRVSSRIAFLLRGKHKTNFTPHVDCGDNVIVLNADKVVLTGQKATEKQYVRHTEYPGGQRFTTPEELMMKNPIKVIENAVKGMLPKNRLGRDLYRNLHAFVGTEHPHEAQKPEKIDINTINK